MEGTIVGLINPRKVAAPNHCSGGAVIIEYLDYRGLI